MATSNGTIVAFPKREGRPAGFSPQQPAPVTRDQLIALGEAILELQSAARTGRVREVRKAALDVQADIDRFLGYVPLDAA